MSLRLDNDCVNKEHVEKVSKKSVFTNNSQVKKSQPKKVNFNLKVNQIHPHGSVNSCKTNDTNKETNINI